jgi:hypothetical protein
MIENEANKSVGGYSLKKNRLKRWIYEHKFTQPYVAKKLDISVREMQDKLNKHELFSEEQIRNLVYLLGAEEAIEVIYFPTVEEKRRVYEKTFLIKGGRGYKE